MSRKELRALQKENEALRKRIAELEGSKAHTNMSEHPMEDSSAYTRLFCESNSYAGYLIRSLKASNIYKRFRAAMLWLSRFRILSTAMRLLSYAAMLIEAGTHVVIVSTLVLFFLPLSALLALVTLLLSLIGQKRANERLARAVIGKDVYVVFPKDSEAMSRSNYIGILTNALSKSNKSIVFAVSPSFWSSRGFRKGKYYMHYRHDLCNVVMLRKYYYFSFKRSVLNKSNKAKSITFIY